MVLYGVCGKSSMSDSRFRGRLRSTGYTDFPDSEAYAVVCEARSESVRLTWPSFTQYAN